MHSMSFVAVIRKAGGEKKIGPLQLAVTWYKIRHAGEQTTHWDIQNKENANLS